MVLGVTGQTPGLTPAACTSEVDSQSKISWEPTGGLNTFLKKNPNFKGGMGTPNFSHSRASRISWNLHLPETSLAGRLQGWGAGQLQDCYQIMTQIPRGGAHQEDGCG